MLPDLFNLSTTGNCREIPQVSSQLCLSHPCVPVPALLTQSATETKLPRKQTKDTCIPSTVEARRQGPIHRLPATRGHCGAESDGCKALQLPPRPALKVLGFMETEPRRKQHNSEKQNQPTSFTPRFIGRQRPPFSMLCSSVTWSPIRQMTIVST